MLKAFEWAFWAALLAAAGYAFVQLQGDALLGVLGLLLLAAAAFALKLGRIRDGTVRPIGVDWRNTLLQFTPHDAGGERKRDQDKSARARDARPGSGRES